MSERMRNFVLSDSKGSRYWLASFQERWDIKIGSHAVREDLEPGKLQSKAPRSPFFGIPVDFPSILGHAFLRKMMHFWVPFLGPKMVPKIGPSVLVLIRFLLSFANGAQKWVPF